MRVSKGLHTEASMRRGVQSTPLPPPPTLPWICHRNCRIACKLNAITARIGHGWYITPCLSLYSLWWHVNQWPISIIIKNRSSQWEVSAAFHTTFHWLLPLHFNLIPRHQKPKQSKNRHATWPFTFQSVQTSHWLAVLKKSSNIRLTD